MEQDKSTFNILSRVYFASSFTATLVILTYKDVPYLRRLDAGFSRKGPDSIPVQPISNFRWTLCHWDNIFSEHFYFYLSIIIRLTFHVHLPSIRRMDNRPISGRSLTTYNSRTPPREFIHSEGQSTLAKRCLLLQQSRYLSCSTVSIHLTPQH